ncbi:MAG: SBBP repeat-containing protein [Bacteroidia bacterium]|nr:SBBP repeat-containing protein [Bacteroidia bacterium]
MKTISLTFILLFSAIISFSQTNNLVWAKAMGGTAFNSASSVRVDASGNVHTVGNFSGTTDFDPGPGTFSMTAIGFDDIFVSKLDVNGNFLWAKRLGGTSYDYAKSIAVDASGNVIVCGYFEGTCDFDPGVGTFNLTSNGDKDIYIAKLNSSGNFLWAKSMGSVGLDEATSIDVDAAGNVYSTGYFNYTVDFDPGVGTFTLTNNTNDNGFISKLDASGNFVFAKHLKVDNNCVGNSITLDGTGNIYACGVFRATNFDMDPGPGTFTVGSIAGTDDIFVLKLNSSGNFVWGKTIGGVDYEEVFDVAIDALGNVYTSGYFQDICDFDPGPTTFTLNAIGFSTEAFISKLDANGNFVWAKQIGGTSDQEAYSITTDLMNNVYFTGYFENVCDFDPGVGTFTLASAGQSDIFISKLDANGNFVFADRIGAGLSDKGNSVQVDAVGNVYTVGEFIGNGIDFDTGVGSYTLASGANMGAFIHKMCMVPSAPSNITPLANQLICAPNNSTTLQVNGLGTINWYASPTSTLSLATGTAFTTPTLAVGSYTYYAEAITCSTSISRTAISFTVSTCAGIENAFQENLNTIKIFPNPVSNTLNIEAKYPIDKVIISDILGKQIILIDSTIEQTQIDVSGLSQGVYFVTVMSRSESHVAKIIKD